jgi:hypothetical protein
MQAWVRAERVPGTGVALGLLLILASCGRSELDPKGAFSDDGVFDGAVPMDAERPGDGGVTDGDTPEGGGPDATLFDGALPPDGTVPPDTGVADTGVPDTGLPDECVSDADCDNGLVCDGAERCQAGRCVRGVALDCDDGVACTVDRCVEPSGCEHVPDDARCPGSFCDGEAHCDPARGCVSEPPVVCDDGDMCTQSRCDEALRRCVHEPWRPPGAVEVCDDGIDNTCNGLVDCADPACVDDPSCAVCEPFETICDDNIDNDCDGLVDCNDPDCQRPGECGCTQGEQGFQCRDGIDNDCDGLVDCADPDCQGTLWCAICLPFEICSVNLDLNCNGLAGCDDPQCFFDPACR